MAVAKSKTIYDVHPGVAIVEKWVAELKSKTGRSVEEWVALVKKEGPKEEKARREWLKNKHKLGMNSAWWIAERAGGKSGEEDTPEGYLAAAVRYVSRAESCARSRSNSGVERAYGGHCTPVPVVPQPAQQKRGNRTATWPNSVAIACWR